MEAAARDLELTNGRLLRTEGYGWQTAGFKRLRAMQAGTAKAYDQRAWWKLPRGIWSVLRVLSV